MVFQLQLPGSRLGLLSHDSKELFEKLLHNRADAFVHPLPVFLHSLVLQVVKEDVEGGLFVALQPQELQPVDGLQVYKDRELVLVEDGDNVGRRFQLLQQLLFQLVKLI